jgi:hypothetical protein
VAPPAGLAALAAPRHEEAVPYPGPPQGYRSVLLHHLSAYEERRLDPAIGSGVGCRRNGVQSHHTAMLIDLHSPVGRTATTAIYDSQGVVGLR